MTTEALMCKCGAGLFYSLALGKISDEAIKHWKYSHTGDAHSPVISYREWAMLRDFKMGRYHATTSGGSDSYGRSWET